MVEEATLAEIAQLSASDVAPGLVAVALALARAMDGSDAPSSLAVAARELRATLDRLRTLAPAQAEGDALDDLATRRAVRRGA